MSSLRPLSLLVLMLAAPLALTARAADSPKADAAKADDSKSADADKGDGDKASEKAEAKADVDPAPAVTAHSVTVDGKVIKYHATTGYMIVKVEEGKPSPVTTRGLDGDGSSGDGSKDDAPKFKDGVKAVAKIFYTAYTLDEVADTAKRPVTFLFNGGPGSSSLWLHMGSVAPRRAALNDEGETVPPPYGIVDNESTWLDRTDLVFIDPVSTGYSRPMPKEDLKQFHGLREDIGSISEFIRLYVTRNERWLSPKIVMGESYGTTRAAGLSDYLQERYGIYLNGIILLSSCLDFREISFSPQNIEPYVAFLPTFATTAWYHRRLSPEMQANTVEEIASEARSFAQGEYADVLGRGDAAPESGKAHAAAELSRFTGIPASEFRLLGLRMTEANFLSRLLLAEGRVLGRYDSRFTGLSYSPGRVEPDDTYDPSEEAVEAPFTAAFNDYVRRELKYSSDLPYEDLIDVSPWNYGDPQNGYPNTADDLRRAMTRNPYLKVWVTASYYDLATPFLGAEATVASLNLDPSVRANIHFTYFKSGHMLYIYTPSRVKLKADFVNFLDEATSQPIVHTSAR
jgi:carboxypeptidase C (cathepsin A)